MALRTLKQQHSHEGQIVGLKLLKDNSTPNLQVISKRWGGHNVMDIKPSNWSWKYVKNWLHFYLLATAIPLAVLGTIVNIRANPELIEIPEGYEPRHWEYYRGPIARWIAKNILSPPEFDQEMVLAHCDMLTEQRIVKSIINRANKVMSFYNDHRSGFFKPYYADYIRIGRQDFHYNSGFMMSLPGEYIDDAHDPLRPVVPIEGMIDGPLD